MNLALFYKALGWALVHSLWQFGFLWILYFGVLSFKKWPSAGRHALALFLSFAGVIWFIANLLFGWMTGSPEGLGLYPAAASSGSFIASLQLLTEKYLLYITYAYLLVTGIQFLKFFYIFYRSSFLYSSGVAKVQVELRQYVARMAMHLDIRRHVQVFISEYVDTPMVIGFLKPTILMPLACVSQLTMAQVESILLHELAHIKRNDYLINMYVSACEILFFFNPFARLLLSSIKSEREHSCDDWVLQYQVNPHAYASALLTLEKSRSSYIQTSLAATGFSRRILLTRVQRILHVPATRQNRILPFTALLTACSLLVFFAFLHPRILPEDQGWRKGFAALAKKLTHPTPVSRENKTMLTIAFNPIEAKHTTLKAPTGMRINPVTTSSPVPDRAPEENLIIPASIRESVSNYEPIQVEAVNIESRNFSLSEPGDPAVPATVSLGGYPYVPSSVYYSVDTAKPKIRTETYRERTAKESMIKAQKALNQLDWKNIEKSLQSKKVNIAQLRKELEKAIAQVNWQQINAQVRDSLNESTQSEYAHALTEEVRELDKWKTQQVQLEKLQGQLQLQQQKYKTETELRELQIQKQVPRNKVIVIL